MKKTYSLITFIFLSILFTQNAYSAEGTSASLTKLQKTLDEKEKDNRAKILKAFLQKYNSPLADNADDFVEMADIYTLDWRLVASISGVESTFGQQIPYNSYNAWGWGVYGNNVVYFSSWKEGIEAVSKGLKENYKDKGATDVYQIGRIYAESKAWPYKVSYFMEKIEELQSQFNSQNAISDLPISL